MNKAGCGVIRDLLPLYLDGICSAESVELVKEHLADCADCRLLAERLKTMEMELDEEGKKEINYMKKLKKHVFSKNLINFGLLFLIIIAGMAVVISKNGDIPLRLYYIILPVLAISSYLMFSDYTVRNTGARWKTALEAAGFILIIYTILMEIFVVKAVQDGIYIGRISPEKLGPVMYVQLLLIAFIHMADFIAAVYMSIRTENSGTVIRTVSVMGCCMALAFISLMKRLDTPQSFTLARNAELIIMLAEGTILILALWLAERTEMKKK